MHPAAIAAWIEETEKPLAHSRKRPRPTSAADDDKPSKTRRIALADMSGNAGSPRKQKNKEKGMRTPSPKKAQPPRDALDACSPDELELELDITTPRPTYPLHPPAHLELHPVPVLSYRDGLANLDHDAADVVCPPSPSRSQSASSAARSSSPKKVSSLWHVGNGVEYTSLANDIDALGAQLGREGNELWAALDDVRDGEAVLPAKLREPLSRAGIGRVRAHHLDHDDARHMDDLLHELRVVRDINYFSRRCADQRDHESEWNNRVHTKLLELALGNGEDRLGFRSVTSARISPEYRPTQSSGIAAAKIVDYALFLEPGASTMADAISSLIDGDAGSINHIGYEGLRSRPIAVSIETKTESRPVEEAKVQLGVWVAAHVARVEALVAQVAAWEAAKARPPTRGRGRPRKGDGQPTPPATEATESLAQNSTLLSDIVFPLIYVQAEKWDLYLARVDPEEAFTTATLPRAHIKIFSSVSIGDTSNTFHTYRLLKSLRVLRDWIDTVYRAWWARLLGTALEMDSG